MCKKIKPYQLFFCLSFIFLALSLFFHSNWFNHHYAKKKLTQTQQYIWDLETEAQQIVNQLKGHEVELADLTQFYDYDYTLLFYKNDQLTYWSNRKFVPESVISRIQGEDNLIIKFQEEEYFVASHTINSNEKLIFAQPIGQSPAVRSLSLFNSKQVVIFDNRNLDFFIPATNLSGDRIGTLSVNRKEKIKTVFLWGSWVLFLVSLFIALYLLFNRLPKNIFFVNRAILLVGSLLLVKVLFKSDPFGVIDNMRLFQPNLFANNYIGQSLGILLINVVILLLGLVLWYKTKPKYRILGRQPKWLKASFMIFCIGLTYFLLSYTVRSIIVDSSITFSFDSFESKYSVLFLFVLFFCILLYFLINIRLLRYLKTSFTDQENLILLMLLSIVSFFVFSISFSFGEIIFLLVWQMITLFSLYFLIHNKEMKIMQIAGFVLYFVLCAIFCAENLKKYTQLKSENQIIQVARKLSLPEDDLALFLIEDLKEEIHNDEVIKDLVSNPFISKQTIIRRIENRYLGRTLKGYEIEYSFIEDSLASEIQSLSDYSTFQYKLVTPFDIASKKETLIIQFKKAKINELEPKSFDRKNYSYAFYENGSLRFLEGNLEQIDTDSYNHLDVGEYRFHKSSVSNLIFRYQDNSLLQLSVKEPIINNSIILLFSNFFSAFFLLFILYLLILNRFKITNSSFFRKSLTNQIQFLVIAILYLTAFIVSIISMRVANQQLSQVEQSQHITELKDIIDQYKDKALDTISFKAYLEKNFQSFEEQLHFYDHQGKLTYTNTPLAYEEMKWPKLINPIVWKDFLTKPLQNITTSEQFGEETIYGFYKVLRADNFDIQGVLYLPALNLKREISQRQKLVIESQFNTFSIVLFSLTLISLLVSQSLTDIFQRLRQRLLAVEIGEDRKLIQWETQDEIGALVQEYNELVKKLDESAVLLARNERESAWRDVAKQVAHEIKNPLTPMKLSIQHLKRRISNEPEDDTVNAIIKTLNALETQMQNLQNIADSFSHISKMDLPNFSKVDLVHLLNEVTSIYQTSKNYHLLYIKEIEEDIAMVNADQTMLSRVLHNLLKNAQQALLPNRPGIIEVEIDESDDYYIIHVKDNGKGISLGNRAKIFTPNFTTKSSGTGIGLMMSKKIIEMHNGTIHFDSIEKQGTKFTIMLPKL